MAVKTSTGTVGIAEWGKLEARQKGLCSQQFKPGSGPPPLVATVRSPPGRGPCTPTSGSTGPMSCTCTPVLHTCCPGRRPRPARRSWSKHGSRLGPACVRRQVHTCDVAAVSRARAGVQCPGGITALPCSTASSFFNASSMDPAQPLLLPQTAGCWHGPAPRSSFIQRTDCKHHVVGL